jgi:hypothetical protein
MRKLWAVISTNWPVFLGLVLVVVVVLAQWEKGAKDQGATPTDSPRGIPRPSEEQAREARKTLEKAYLATPEGKELERKAELRRLTTAADNIEQGVKAAEALVASLLKAEQALDNKEHLDPQSRDELESARQKNRASLQTKTAELVRLCTEFETQLESLGNALLEGEEIQRRQLLQRLRSAKTRLKLE